MASTHKSLRSSTANKRPTTAIADGQIALNTNAASPGLFFKDSAGATIIKVGPVHVGTTAPNATPAAGGSSGNSTGEVWLDTSLTPVGVKIWNGSAWVNATPTGSTSVAGLLALASNAETQAGANATKAVTPAGLQSKVSDSTSTTSSTTIASSTAVKAAYDLANAALPKAGGTVTGALNISETGSLVFEGATADDFETTLGVVDPTADRTINLPDVNGTVITTGDNGTITSTMIANGTIVDADISGSAEIAVSKLADGAARQVLQTDAAGTGVEWTSNVALPGTASATSFSPTGSSVPTNGMYLPTTNTVAISSNGTERISIDSSGRLLVGTSSAGSSLTNTVELAGAGTLTNQPSYQVYAYPGSSDTNTGYFQFFRSASATLGTNAIVGTNDRLGVLRWSGADGTNYISSAEIYAEVDGTPGANDMPGRLVFSSNPGSPATGPSEAMRINSAQELLIGYTSDNGAYKLQVNSQIFATSATIATSDGRYKENVATLDGCVNLVKALRPVSFDWKHQEPITRIDEEGETVVVREAHNFPDGTQVGFIAQEVEIVLADKPWLGSVIKQNVRHAVTDNDGNELAPEEEFLGIAEGNLVAVLTSALKEAIGEIESLKARVAALEAN